MFQKLSALPLYPLLLAAHFPLFLLTRSLAVPEAGVAVRPVLVGVACTLLAMGVLWLLLRDLHRAALWTALGIVLVCYFKTLDPVFDGLIGLAMAPPPPLYVLAGLLVLIAPILLFARPGPDMARIANLATLIMLAFPLAPLVEQEAQAFTAGRHPAAEREQDAPFSAASPIGQPPSIVHIVLDGYGRQDVLAELYGFDNRPFLDGLRGLGFEIAGQATAPYNQTLLVMSSVLSGSYLEDLLPAEQPADLRQALSERFRHNPVMTALGRLGYQTAAFDVRYDPVRMDRVDRLLAPYALSNFEKVLLEETLLDNVAQLLGLGLPSLDRAMFEQPYENGLTPPFFLYVHVLAPHPPFDVDPQGRHVAPAGGSSGLRDGSHFTKDEPGRRRIYRDGYVDKLTFTNELVLRYAKRLVERVPDPKLIIIHGDHGGGLHFDQDSVERSCLFERFSPLLAVYSSDGRLELPPDLNLTNLYRLVFNTYLDTNLELLPSRSVFAGWKEPARQIVLTPEQLHRPCRTEATVLDGVSAAQPR
ncbi:MAG TPA: sulfatase-like hydrolase/transferase [Geminicoccus sp.]|uniref:sulfatase-like hydrolase/transferase n=1 Tax=Geminicoccus sp. TaxID=2024832 RepID=UPI002B6D9FDC|nr:sulfatase-like hydrolase/transferase [Geminicoccus sp.]HWL68850.1 sulfatase-like hydrolase/transferase [Geminicoccus sp.]